MKQNILKFDVMTDDELQGVDGGALPLVPIAIGFIKGFVYTSSAILTTKKLITGN